MRQNIISSLLSLLLLLAGASAKASRRSTAATADTSHTALKHMHKTVVVKDDATAACSKLYWSSTTTKASENRPASLHCAALGRSASGNIITLSIGTGGVPSAHYFNPTTNQWTSKQTLPSVSAEGATIGRATTSGGTSDAESGDVFVLFGGQQAGGQYSKQVIRYTPDAGFSVLTNTATGTDSSPMGRASGSLTGIQTDADGNIRFLLVGGVDDESDFADVWILTLQREGNTFTWNKGLPQENGVGFVGRTGHSANRWISSTDSAGDSARVVVFGGCHQSAATTACFNDVWLLSVTSDSTSPVAMTKLAVIEGGDSTPPTSVEDASMMIHNDVLYIYGGCAMSAGGTKECFSQVRSIPLTGTALAWSTPATGNSVLGQKYGGVGVVASNDPDSSSLFVLLGGCSNGKSECAVVRQDLNLHGVCAGACKNGGTVSDLGVCKCAQDFEGIDCSTQISASSVDCPNGCSDQGECVAGKCKCHATYGGESCATRVCSVDGPGDCSGHGACKTIPGSDTPLCVCTGSYHGVICSEMFCAPRDCGKVGECNTKLGKCDCIAGYGGAGCTKQDLCLGNCTGHGSCTASRATADVDSSSACVCNDGFEGIGCENDGRCNSKFGGCGEHGTCKDLECECDIGFTGMQCEQKECPGNGCAGHGSCDPKTGTCTCEFGYVGEGCVERLQCPNNCTSPSNGLCVSAGGADVTIGQCKCTQSFRGDDCSFIICPKSFPHQFADKKEECSGDERGQCNGKTGKCQCDPAYGGFACEFSCPSGKKFRANEIHPSHDHMNMGRRTPIDAAVAQLDAALGACSGHGVCVTTLGGDAKCLCENGIEGEACDAEVQCPVANCSGNGACFRGKCLCVAGFLGLDCAKRVECTLSDNGAECSG